MRVIFMRWASCLGFMLLKVATVFSQSETLVWSDEFNGSGSPDPAYWKYDLGKTGWGNNEVQNYTNSTNNVRQENGHLIIEALKYGNEWTSARIITLGKISFTYGRIVFRAKLPTGSGTWPALWMLGDNLTSVGWPACGEIDVMEHVGKNPGVVQSAMHTSSSYGNTVNKGSTNVPTFNSEFHEYEVNWTTEKMEFKVDGALYYTYNPATKNSATWPFNKPCFFIMNIAMGGNLGSDPQYETGGLKNGIDPTLSSARMEIDYLRVYQKEIVTDVAEGVETQFQIYPNPTNDSVRILVDQPKSSLTIQDLYGKTVLQAILENKETILNLSMLPKGNYAFILTVNGTQFIKRIILY